MGKKKDADGNDPNEELAKLIQAHRDQEQRLEPVSATARLIAVFHTTLTTSGVDEESALNMTLAWMERWVHDDAV